MTIEEHARLNIAALNARMIADDRSIAISESERLSLHALAEFVEHFFAETVVVDVDRNDPSTSPALPSSKRVTTGERGGKEKVA